MPPKATSRDFTFSNVLDLPISDHFLAHCPELLDYCPNCFQRALYIPDLVQAPEDTCIQACLGCGAAFSWKLAESR